MANKGKIDEWIDEPAVKKQYDLMVKYVEDIVNRISSIKKVEVNLSGANTITDTTNAIKNLAAEQKKLADTEKQLHTQQQQLVNDGKSVAAAVVGMDDVLSKYSNSLEQNIRIQVRNRTAIDQVKAAQKDLDNEYKNGRVSIDSYTTKTAALVQEQEELKISNSELTQSIKAAIKQDQAASGSIDERAQRLGLLKDLYRQLSE